MTLISKLLTCVRIRGDLSFHYQLLNYLYFLPTCNKYVMSIYYARLLLFVSKSSEKRAELAQNERFTTKENRNSAEKAPIANST